MWADPARPDRFPDMVAEAERLTWIQLPYAGIEPFAHHLDPRWSWTCGKGVYAPTVAETVMAQVLALCKNLHGYARATTWEGAVGRVLAGSRVTVLGGGGITRCLLPLLAPFGCDVTVVRRSDESVAGADRTITMNRLHEVLPRTDVLVLALAPHHPARRQHPGDGPRVAGAVRGRERTAVLHGRRTPRSGRRGPGLLSVSPEGRRCPIPW